jgi:thioesterase domain-containing protein
MRSLASTTIFFPGVGGEIPLLADLDGDRKNISFESISYPHWHRLADTEYTVEALIADLETQIAIKAPEGPLQLVGYSIGAHFAYIAALHLSAAGREVAGFCILDSFMIGSIAPSPGWQGRALADAVTIMRSRQTRELILFVRSKFWRALLRLVGDRLPHLLSRPRLARLVSQIAVLDKVFYKELTIQVFMRKFAPWIQRLDSPPSPINAPTFLLRTQENSQHDEAWRRRCPRLETIEIPGQHQRLFQPENIASVRAAYATAMRKLTENCSSLRNLR